VVKLSRQLAAGDRAGLVNQGTGLAMLEQPALAHVPDLDFHDGRPYLVREHIDGVDLGRYAAPVQVCEAKGYVLESPGTRVRQGPTRVGSR
jgi:hypothetical protein